MTPTTDSRLPLQPLSRPLAMSLIVGILGTVAGAFFLVQVTLNAAGLITVGEAGPLVTALGAAVAVPIFAIVTFIITCFGGALIALFNRAFSFRRMYLLTASAVALSLLIAAAGTSLVMLWQIAPQIVVFSTTLLNMLVAACYGRLLYRYAGASKGGAITLTAVWSVYLLAVGAWGVIHG